MRQAQTAQTTAWEAELSAAEAKREADQAVAGAWAASSEQQDRMLAYAEKAECRRQADEQRWHDQFWQQEQDWQAKELAWKERQERWARSHRRDAWQLQGASHDSAAASSGGPVTEGWGAFHPTTAEGRAKAGASSLGGAPAPTAPAPARSEADPSLAWWMGEHVCLGDGGDPGR